MNGHTHAQTSATPQTATDTSGRGIVDSPGAQPSFRLRRLDVHNWVIERKQPKGKWVNAGYFPELEAAAKRLLELTEGESDEAAVLIGAIRSARSRIAQAVPEERSAESDTEYRETEIAPQGGHMSASEPKYHLTRDTSAKCWVIQAPTTDKTKKGWKSVAWLPTLEAAGRSLFDRLVLESEQPDLLEVIKEAADEVQAIVRRQVSVEAL